MIQPTPPLPRRFTVVVGVDFSPSSERALATARDLCALSGGGGRLHVVHVVSLFDLGSEMAASPVSDSESEADRLSQAHLRLSSSLPLAGLSAGGEVTLHVKTGVAHRVITQVARDCGADLVLVGTLGLHGTRQVVASSVAGHVIRDAPCPVIAVRPRTSAGEEKNETADL